MSIDKQNLQNLFILLQNQKMCVLDSENVGADGRSEN